MADDPGKVPVILPQISSPQDLKKLSLPDLNTLADEIRSVIIHTVNQNGGHLASNLGVVELGIALHLVFNSPDDSIIWDVGHQSYTHKLLTGRYEDFSTLRKSGGISGFPKTSESPHDAFNTGHASTSISAALGMLAGDVLKKTKNRSAAVIGDGALTGGLAFEALSHAGQLQLPLMVILNDNKMSISPNVGGISRHLSGLSMKEKYQAVRRAIDRFVKRIPLIGDFSFMLMMRLKRAVKAVFYADNFFVELGFEYAGPIDGHNLKELIRVIQDAKDLNKPVVVHVITRKGKGYVRAEESPEIYHAVQGQDQKPDKNRDQNAVQNTFTRVFSEAVLELGGRNERITVITAAMEDGTGLSSFKKKFPSRFFDVGIAEEHAVTFAAGLAARGLRPVVAVYSSFIQRALDQIIHDVCLQKLPVIFALDRAGLVSDDGDTHQGIYDISLFRSAPGLTILAPAGEEELKAMLAWAVNKSAPVMIRYPKANCPMGDPSFSLPIEEGRGVWIRKNNSPGSAKLCILFTGSLYSEVMEAASLLEAENIKADIYNQRFLKPLDEDYLTEILGQYETILIADEGIKTGGFGEYIASLINRHNISVKLYVVSVNEKFDAQGKREELLRQNNLDGKGIFQVIMEL